MAGAGGDDDYTIRIWNTNNGELISTLTGHTGTVLDLIVLDNGFLASSSYDDTIKLWNLETISDNSSSLPEFTIELPYQCHSMAVLANRRLVCSMSDKGLALIDILEGVLIQTLPYDLDPSENLQAFSFASLDNGSHFAGCMGFIFESDGIYVWNGDYLKLVNTINGTNNICNSYLTTLSDGNLATGGQDGLVRILYTASGYYNLII